METEYSKVKCKRSSEMEPREERKSLKVSIKAVPTKGLKSTNSRAEEKSCLMKCGSVIKYNRKQKDVEKATGPGNNGSSQSETRSANQIDDKAPSKDIQVPEKEMKEILNHEASQDEQSLKNDKKKYASHEAAQKEFHDSLKARVAELRQETTMLNQELRRHATMCMQLVEDNKLLMDELKKMCEPCVIEILEAKNPDKNHQTD